MQKKIFENKIIFLLLFLCLTTQAFSSINFVHIPKTGGTTLQNVMEPNFPKAYTYPYRSLNLSNFTTRDRQVILDIFDKYPTIKQPLVLGHLPFWFFQEKDPNFDTSFFYTVLRDPIERVLSHARYRKKMYNEPLDLLNIPDNIMCLMLCSDPTLDDEKVLEDAKRNLHRMDYIVFMDDFDRGVRGLFHKVGIHQPRVIPVRNTTEKETVAPEIVEEVRLRNALDIALYEYASKNLRHRF